MAGKLKEPMVNTDYRREPVCILPIGFYFDDDLWEKIWQRFDENGASLTREDSSDLFPEEPVLKRDRVKPGGVRSDKDRNGHGITRKNTE
jgi:hypothetical protein